MKLLKKLLGLAILLSTSAIANAQTNYSNIYFFGDSLSAIGNPIGSDCSTNKLADGTCATWANDLYKDSYQNYISNTDKADYAVGGAHSSDLGKQINTFGNDHKPDSNALYVVWVGGNDLMGLASQIANQIGSHMSDPGFILNLTMDALKNFQIGLLNGASYDGVNQEATIGNIINTMQTLQNNYGAKNFVIVNLPNLSYTPAFQGELSGINNICTSLPAPTQFCSALTGGLDALADSLVKTYNDELQQTISQKFPNAKIFDANTVAQNIHNNGSSYTPPITNITGTCGDPILDPMKSPCQSYMFYNDIHPSAHSHQILADALYKQL